MRKSHAYTFDDHRSRSTDRYARAKYEVTRRWLLPHVRAGMTLLNVGCGSGYFNGIARELGLRVVACEPDPSAYELALARADGCEIHNCDLAGFAQCGASGDFIVFHDVLEHIEDDRSAAQTLCGLMRPGGRAIVSVPALQSLFGRHDEELGHYRRYSRRSLTRALEPSFEIVRMRYYGALSIPVVLLFSKLMRTPYPKSASGQSVLARAYGALCDVEVGVTFPTGTSIIAEIVPRI